VKVADDGTPFVCHRACLHFVARLVVLRPELFEPPLDRFAVDRLLELPRRDDVVFGVDALFDEAFFFGVADRFEVVDFFGEAAFFFAVDFFDDEADFLGTFFPSLRASLSPIAMACLRLFTFFPEPPLLSVPSFISCIALCTLFDAPLLYFRPDEDLELAMRGAFATFAPIDISTWALARQ
jgi:hypothetical protein